MDKNKIQRGMVFLYNINPRINKLEHPSISVNGKIYHDYNTYGFRPWIVVSINNNHMCSVIPMSTRQAFTELENNTRVDLIVDGTDSCALCEKIRTINSVELGKYITTLTKEDMEKIDKAILNHLGITYTSTNTTNRPKPTDTISVDSLIDNICKSDKFNSYIKELIKGYTDSLQNNPPIDTVVQDIDTTTDTSDSNTSNTTNRNTNTDTSDSNTNTEEITPTTDIKDITPKDIHKMIRSSIKYLNTAYKLKGIK